MRLIVSIIKYANVKNIPGLLLFLDFEKAFDTLECSFVHKALKFLGFGSQSLKWIDIFYSDTESCILNAGQLFF